MNSIYGCTKFAQRLTDAGSIPATSTTTGVHGFDGLLSANGHPATVPPEPPRLPTEQEIDEWMASLPF